MKPIKVLEIISGFAVEGPLGGIERFGIELARSFDRSKIEPILCGMWAYGTPFENQWVAQLQDEGIQSFIVGQWQESSPYRSFAQVNNMLSGLFDEVDIIHSHCQFGDILAILNRQRLGAKAIVRTVHNEREWGKRPFRRLLLTNIVYPFMFNLEIGVAEQVVNNLNQRLVAQWMNKRAVKSFNALNLERFLQNHFDKNAKKMSLGISPTTKIVGTVGRLTPQKGYRYFLDAAAQLIKDFPEILFLIIGDGELRNDLESQANQLGLTKHVLFMGARKDIEELIPVMDVFVNSSRWEGLPTVIMESMAARVPVVATNVGGNSELIENNVTGWLVPPNDVAQLANTISKVLTEEDQTLSSICQRAYKHVQQRFSIQSVARQHEAFYYQVLTKSR